MIAAHLLAFSLAAAVSAAAPAGVGAQGSATSRVSFPQLSREADLAREQNREDAIQLYQRALALRPEWPEGLWYSGTLLYEKERYAECRDTLRHFVALQPGAGPGWAMLGLSEFQTRQYPRALDHLQRAMALGLGDRKEMTRSVFYFVAALLTRLERYDDSMDMLVRIIAQDEDPVSLVEPAGLAGLRMPLLPAEIPADRRDLVRLAGQAVVALQTQHYEDADAAFKKLLAAYPEEPGVHFLYGAYLMPLHPDDGIRELKRELEVSPSHVLARVRLAAEYLEQQKTDEAIRLSQEAVKLDPKHASAHMLLGEAYVVAGRLRDGIKELERARDDDPLTGRIHWDLLRAYSAAGRGDDAKREKEEIEKLTHPAADPGPANHEKSSTPAPPQ
jgi:tetratricopeptide (TPR) repeat protein